MPDSELPQWLDKVDAGMIGVLTLDDGERMTAQVVGFDDERDELVVTVISPKRSRENGAQDGHAIPVNRIVSFQPQPRAAQPWPYSASAVNSETEQLGARSGRRASTTSMYGRPRSESRN